MNQDFNRVGGFNSNNIFPRYTTPEASQWTMINPPRMIDGERWVFGDQVEVPESQEPGEYVLSFRWDCQNTAQIWSACANIEIV